MSQITDLWIEFQGWMSDCWWKFKVPMWWMSFYWCGFSVFSTAASIYIVTPNIHLFFTTDSYQFSYQSPLTPLSKNDSNVSEKNIPHLNEFIQSRVKKMKMKIFSSMNFISIGSSRICSFFFFSVLCFIFMWTDAWNCLFSPKWIFKKKIRWKIQILLEYFLEIFVVRLMEYWS